MLTAILERSSWVVAKFGMPLVYFYHLIIASVFLNTAADDARGLERLANNALAPMQYFFEGKKASLQVDGSYTLERRFNYDEHFFVKTAAAVTALPFSIVVGTTLKSISYLAPSTRERASRIKGAAHCKAVSSNQEYYQSIGLEIGAMKEAEWIEPPQFTRHPEAKHRLAPDIEALKEVARILEKCEIPFWIDCGTCLGAYQYGGVIPHDWDIDIAVLLPDFQNVKNALNELDAEKLIVQDWSGRANPKSYLKILVRESGGMIDLYHFAIDEENQMIHTLLSNEHNIFMPRSWIEREQRCCTPMPFARVFPLKKALFEGFEVPVPGQIVEYLQTFYGEDLAPARLYNEITGIYEKDESHPYWQLSHAH